MKYTIPLLCHSLDKCHCVTDLFCCSLVVFIHVTAGSFIKHILPKSVKIILLFCLKVAYNMYSFMVVVSSYENFLLTRTTTTIKVGSISILYIHCGKHLYLLLLQVPQPEGLHGTGREDQKDVSWRGNPLHHHPAWVCGVWGWWCLCFPRLCWGLHPWLSIQGQRRLCGQHLLWSLKTGNERPHGTEHIHPEGQWGCGCSVSAQILYQPARCNRALCFSPWGCAFQLDKSCYHQPSFWHFWKASQHTH